MKKFLLALAICTSAVSAYAQVLVTEAFGGATLPTGWSSTSNPTAPSGFTMNVAASQGFPIPAGGYAGVNDDGCGNTAACAHDQTRLISPAFDLSAESSLFIELSQYYFGATYQGITETAKLQASTDGGATWANVADIEGNTAGGWQSAYFDVSTYAGQSAVHFSILYNDGGGWLYGYALNEFTLFIPENVLSLATNGFATTKFIDAVPGPVATTAFLLNDNAAGVLEVKSLGLVPVTSFDVEVTYNGTTTTQNVSGITINAYETYIVELNDFAVVAGNQNVNIEITNINGGNDVDLTDNTQSGSIEGVTPAPGKRVFAEEGTGTWCQWCPRGKVFMDYMEENFSDYFVGVMVHNGDNITNTEYDAALGITGFPGCQIDRTPDLANSDPGDFYQSMVTQVQVAPVATLELGGYLDEAANIAQITVTGTFLTAFTGGRMNVILMEDNVNAGESQSNAYSGGGAGPMGGWEDLGPSVSASTKLQNNVARALGGGFKGDATSLPSSVAAGQVESYTYPIELDALWNVDNIRVVGIVLKNSTGIVSNAVSAPLSAVLNADQIKALRNLRVFPNPASDVANVEVSLDQANQVSINVLNLMGQTTFSKEYGIMNGTNTLTIDTKSMPTGTYMVQINIGEKMVTRKLQVVR